MSGKQDIDTEKKQGSAKGKRDGADVVCGGENDTVDTTTVVDAKKKIEHVTTGDTGGEKTAGNDAKTNRNPFLTGLAAVGRGGGGVPFDQILGRHGGSNHDEAANTAGHKYKKINNHQQRKHRKGIRRKESDSDDNNSNSNNSDSDHHNSANNPLANLASPIKKMFENINNRNSNHETTGGGDNDDVNNTEKTSRNECRNRFSNNGGERNNVVRAVTTAVTGVLKKSSSSTKNGTGGGSRGTTTTTTGAVAESASTVVAGVEEDVSALSLSDHLKPSIGMSRRSDQTASKSSTVSRSSSVKSGSGETVVVGPVLDFLTADATLFMFLCFAVALYPTIQHWAIIMEGESIPLRVVVSWMVCAFAAGQALSFEVWRTSRLLVPIPTAVTESVIADMPAEVAIHARDCRVQDEVYQQARRQKHSFLLKALGSTSTRKLKFAQAKAALVEAPVKAIIDSSGKVWTNLTPGRKGQSLWERTIDPTRASVVLMARQQTGGDKKQQTNVLMTRLLKNPIYKRARIGKRRSVRIVLPASGDDDHTGDAQGVSTIVSPGDDSPTSASTGGPQGRFSLDGADTLDDMNYVVVPQLALRGMDIFLNDSGDPEADVCTHPWLIQNGLRDVPTWTINIMTPWGNILVYLEMPSWVTDRIDGHEENPDDDEETLALKRFLNGDDKYRNERLKIVPVVVEGPLAVRILAPPKKEFVVSCDTLPVTYRSREATVCPQTKRNLCPALEVELDCVSSRAMRGMAGILKRNLESLCIDVACVITPPPGKGDEEPHACLGIFRFNHIDLKLCPIFPDRYEMEQQGASAKTTTATTSPDKVDILSPDVSRASALLHIDPSELSKLIEEADQ